MKNFIAASLIAENKIDLKEILSDTEFIDIDNIQSAFQKALKPGGFQAILKLG